MSIINTCLEILMVVVTFCLSTIAILSTIGFILKAIEDCDDFFS